MNTPARILVVDDEPDLESLIRQRFRQQIRNGQYEFEFALNGREALKKVDVTGNFDAVMTDINMPEMDGLTFLGHLNEKDSYYKAIVVTAYNDLNNIRTAMNRGAFDFLTKPIDFSDLEATINKTINESRMIRQGVKAQSDLGVAIVEKEHAVRSERIKQQFLANMSHEIRTPLNAVTGIVNLLISKDPKPDQLFYLQTMRQASNNLLGIINDILDLAKIEAGKVSLEKIPFDFYGQLNNVIHTLKFKSDEKGIDLTISIDPSVPEYISGDPVRLSQILTNLISNAIKFTAEGEVSVQVSAVDMNERKMVTIKVIDQGIGIAPQNIGKIFESFTQENDDTTRKFGGTGLGLTITRQLIEMHNGTIHVASELGKGSVFSVQLPYDVAEKPEDENLQYTLTSDDLNLDGPLNLLLVEDQPFNQMVAVDTLELLFDNLTVDIANNGKEAVEKVSSKNYHLVLMDINMPEMDGYEATRAIRALQDEKSKTLIMAMTASVIKEEVNRCYVAGMNDFIPKPFEPKQLKQKIIQLVSSKKSIFENQKNPSNAN
jgi:signal transduction histidine kinase